MIISIQVVAYSLLNISFYIQKSQKAKLLPTLAVGRVIPH